MKIKFSIVLIGLVILFYSGAYPNGANVSSSKTQTVRLTALNLLNDVPDVRQPSDYSCGPTSLQAVLNYYGIDKRADDIINMTHTTPDQGTPPENIADAARQFGLNAEVKEGLTLEDLQKYFNHKIPVIIDCQAWTEQKNINWALDEIDGHYMVVIGIDNDNIYFEDPSILGSRGYIPCPEFLDRWHDEYIDHKTGLTKKTFHMGIVITGKEHPAHQALMKIN